MHWKCYIFSVYMMKTGLITITSILLTTFIMLSYAPIFNGSATAIAPSSIERSASPIANNFSIKEYQVPPGTHPHDVAPMISNQDNNTIVWFTA
jgi:streptogramin lyase